MKTMKSGIMIALVCAILAMGVAMAAPTTVPGQNKLLCFDGTTDGFGYGGTCTIEGNGARGPATLDNTDNNTNGSYSGVYVLNSNMYGQELGDVKHLYFVYSGDNATPGAPRFSIPVDTTGDNATDFWVYAAAYYCNDGNGTVDVLNDETCQLFVSNDPLVSYENWDALVAAFPDATIAMDNYVFIVADEPGMWTVEAVKFGSANK